MPAQKGVPHRKRGDGSWVTTPGGLKRWVVMVGYKPDGRGGRVPLIKWFSGRTEAACRRLRADWERDQAEGRVTTGDRPRLTLAQWLAQWMSLRRVGERVRQQHGRYIEADIVPAIGHLRLRPAGPADEGALAVEHLEALYLANAAHPRKALELHRIMHGALKRARRLRLVPENVAELVDPPKYEPREMHPPTREEVTSLLCHLVPADRRLCRILAASQCRPSEVVGLEWPDVRWREGALRIERTRATRGDPDKSPTKTRRSRRVIHLDEEDMELLREHRKEQMAAIAEAGTRWRDHNLIFPAANGMPMRWSDFWKRFVRARTKAQLPGVRPYDLRHFGITELLEEGIPIEDVSSRAGHANVRITDEVYRHPRGHKDRAAAGATRHFWGASTAAADPAGDGAVQ